MGRRRGLFASRDMRKGEVVHDGTDSDVVFPDAMAYRRFVFALPRKAACDITEWTWAQRLEQNGPMMIMLAINASAMLNPSFTSEEANVLPETSTSQLYYSTRNIKRGEEILTDLTFRDWTNFAATDLGLQGRW
uniref:SET domain-containing protein n=1 Tax=Skeletonema marinoi TaxID=267567 RepID=A0A7S2KC40_9STRA|mmetsp:Transcript_11272/g.19200  ORF Transcript_11272/g.19200 Transcript_11272/m.19200 type:complete len:134 (+) Transcript_11272:297-698(+)